MSTSDLAELSTSARAARGADRAGRARWPSGTTTRPDSAIAGGAVRRGAVARRRRPVVGPRDRAAHTLNALGQMSASTQTSQRGRRARHTRRPCSMSRSEKRPRSSSGISRLRSCSTFTGSVSVGEPQPAGEPADMGVDRAGPGGRSRPSGPRWPSCGRPRAASRGPRGRGAPAPSKRSSTAAAIPIRLRAFERKNPVEWIRVSSSSGFAVGEVRRGRVAGEQRRGHLVDHLVGRLRREDRGDQQLEGVVVHERAPRVGVLDDEPLQHHGGALACTTRQRHGRNLPGPGHPRHRHGRRAGASVPSRRPTSTCSGGSPTTRPAPPVSPSSATRCGAISPTRRPRRRSSSPVTATRRSAAMHVGPSESVTTPHTALSRRGRARARPSTTSLPRPARGGARRPARTARRPRRAVGVRRRPALGRHRARHVGLEPGPRAAAAAHRARRVREASAVPAGRDGAPLRAWAATRTRGSASTTGRSPATPTRAAGTEAALAAREREPWFDPAGFLLAVDDQGLAGFCWTKVHLASPPVEPLALGEIYVIGVDPTARVPASVAPLVLAGLANLHERHQHLPSGCCTSTRQRCRRRALPIDRVHASARVDRAYAMGALTRYGATHAELEALLGDEPRYRVEQVWDALWRRRVPLADATELPGTLRARLDAALPLALTPVVEAHAPPTSATRSGGGRRRRRPGRDGAHAHAPAGQRVRLVPGRAARWAARSARPGQAGFERHLDAAEIVEQVLRAQHAYRPAGHERRLHGDGRAARELRAGLGLGDAPPRRARPVGPAVDGQHRRRRPRDAPARPRGAPRDLGRVAPRARRRAPGPRSSRSTTATPSPRSSTPPPTSPAPTAAGSPSSTPASPASTTARRRPRPSPGSWRRGPASGGAHVNLIPLNPTGRVPRAGRLTRPAARVRPPAPGPGRHGHRPTDPGARHRRGVRAAPTTPPLNPSRASASTTMGP